MSADVDALLRPKSIAIIGASADGDKLNGRPLRYLERDGYAGWLYPVNPKYDAINGRPCYRAIADLPEAPDLAIVAVAAVHVAQAIAELGALGTRTALVFASGFGETGADGAVLEEDVKATARKHRVRLCGPNTLGLINAFDGVTATFSQYAQQMPLAGPIAFASQSGAFGTGICALARARGLGFGYFVNTGNQADLTLFEVLGAIAKDDRVSVLCAYIEGLTDGRELIALADTAMSLGKPLVITKVGRRDAGARAAASHTGSLAGEDRVFDGVACQYGIVRARNEEHLLDLVGAFTCCPVPEGNGVAIVTQSGGAGALMADRAEDLELAVPVLSAPVQARLTSILPPFGTPTNPVDVTGQFIAEPELLRRSVEAALEDDQVHVALIWLQLMWDHADTMVEIFTQLKATAEKPFLVCWIAAPEDALTALRERGVCVIGAAERAVEAAAGLVRFGAARKQFEKRRLLPFSVRWREHRPARTVPSADAADLLARAGLKHADCLLADDPAEARDAAQKLGFPVAVKIESADIGHKSEVGGVRLDLKDGGAVEQAAAEILDGVKVATPEARIDGLLVQKMVPPAAELVLGVRRDPAFGPVVMVGLGGIFVEALDDVAFAAASVSRKDAAGMIRQLHGQAILDGARGQPAVNRDALVDAIVALSDFALAHPDMVELDLNPVFAGGTDIIAVDWLMRVDEKETP